MGKLVFLEIISSDTPCTLTVLSCNGQIIKRVTLNSFKSKICFCTKEQNLKLILACNNMSLYRKISVCKNNCIRLSFNTRRRNRVNCITLSDANYGFPVQKAILSFK